MGVRVITKSTPKSRTAERVAKKAKLKKPKKVKIPAPKKRPTPKRRSK